jgi:hypothetical protein
MRKAGYHVLTGQRVLDAKLRCGHVQITRMPYINPLGVGPYNPDKACTTPEVETRFGSQIVFIL